MSKPIRFRSMPTQASITDPQQVDRDNGVIFGVSACQAVEALGHGMLVDETTIEQVVNEINASATGIKVRFTHPGMCDDGTAKMLGRVKNARLSDDGTKAICDLYLANYASKSPDGNLRAYVLARVAEDPESFGLSIAAYMSKSWKLEDGSEVEAQYESDDDGGGIIRPDNATTDLPLARIEKLSAVDVVGEPAANRDGMFSAQSAMSDDAFKNIDAYIEEHGIDQTRLFQFAMRYFDARGIQLSKAIPASASQPNRETAMKPEILKSLRNAHPEFAGLILDMFADGKGEVEVLAAIKDAKHSAIVAELATATKAIAELTKKHEADEKKAKEDLAAKDAAHAALAAELATAKKVADLGKGAPAPVGGLESDEGADPKSDAALEKKWATDPTLRAQFMNEKDAFIAFAKNDAFVNRRPVSGKTTHEPIDAGNISKPTTKDE